MVVSCSACPDIGPQLVVVRPPEDDPSLVTSWQRKAANRPGTGSASVTASETVERLRQRSGNGKNVGEDEAVTFHDVADTDIEGIREAGAVDDEGVKFAILPARVHPER